MRSPWPAFLTALSLSAFLSAAEPPPRPPVTAADMERARLFAQQGDTHTALLTAFRVLREGADEEVRGGARQALQEWGFAAQELLTVEPGTMKPEELNALCERANRFQTAQARNELEMSYCERLLQSAVQIGRTADGRCTVTANEADLMRAVSGLIQIALSTPSSGITEQAQQQLERMNCVGARLETARKAVAEGRLPAELRDEIVAAAGVDRLRQYREWLESTEDDGETQMRKAVARQLGMSLFQHCEKNLQSTTTFRRDSETVGYWRTAAQIPANF